MSRFYAMIEGNRGAATRQGTAKSGMYGHIRGWNTGASVTCFASDGKDTVRVCSTGGSINQSTKQTLAVLDETGLVGGEMLNLVKALQDIMTEIENKKLTQPVLDQAKAILARNS